MERMIILLAKTNGLGIVHVILSDSPRNGLICSPLLTSQLWWTALSHFQVGGVLKGSWKTGHSRGRDDWN